MAELSTQTDKNLADFGRYANIVLDGCAVTVRQLSITHLNPNFTKFSDKEYQVFCDDYRLQFCKNYKDLFEAVNKFLSLKQALYPREN